MRMIEVKGETHENRVHRLASLVNFIPTRELKL